MLGLGKFGPRQRESRSTSRQSAMLHNALLVLLSILLLVQPRKIHAWISTLSTPLHLSISSLSSHRHRSSLHVRPWPQQSPRSAVSSQVLTSLSRPVPAKAPFSRLSATLGDKHDQQVRQHKRKKHDKQQKHAHSGQDASLLARDAHRSSAANKRVNVSRAKIDRLDVADRLDINRLGVELVDSAELRLNKVFATHFSRRQADILIKSGRVTVNGQSASQTRGMKVTPQDVICLDGKQFVPPFWKSSTVAASPATVVKEKAGDRQFALSSFKNTAASGANQIQTHAQTQTHAPVAKGKYSGAAQGAVSTLGTTDSTFSHVYIKYWKPRGVVCTTNRSVSHNILTALEEDSLSQSPLPTHTRIYPVGRLDKETSGLILMTSDGRLPQRLLGGISKVPKVYRVTVDHDLTPQALQSLSQGVVITTVAQRNRGQSTPLTAKTLPAHVQKITPRSLEITIVEGRNRQVRKMLEAVGYNVLRLHRLSFGPLTLKGLEGPRHWAPLSDGEQKTILRLVEQSVRRERQGKKR
jgi:pseudouridine synthase